MREILFRAKRVDNGEWVEGDLVHSKTTSRGVIVEIFTLDMRYEGNPETLGQFTGLCDKNGKKIFEGDIVKYHCEACVGVKPVELIGQIYFNSADCFFCIHYNSHNGFICDDYLSDILDCEVIGNIHDSPELLEKEE